MTNSSVNRKLASRSGSQYLGRLLAICAIALLLHGCGAGSGNGGISIAGDNQNADPATVEYPIAYVRRPVPVANATPSNLQNPFAFNPGAHLLVRSRADGNAPETNVTDALFPNQENLYDVKDLAVSPDGKWLVFALHAPMLPNTPAIDQPSWDIYTYNFQTKQLKAVITTKTRTDGSDVAPQFLEDGRIAFVSDRQTTSRSLMPPPAYSGDEETLNRKAGVLHVITVDKDGNGDPNTIKQISFNLSHDLAPSQLRSGKLVFTRWDHMNGNNRMNLYTVNPSGMGLSILYGYHSHGTGATDQQLQFSQPREMEDGRLLTIMRRYSSRSLGGDLVAIDVNRYSDNTQAVWEYQGLAGPAQQSLATNPVVLDSGTGTATTQQLSPGGEFGAAYPLFDGTGRLLISWSQCRIIDQGNIKSCVNAPANAQLAPLLYGIWIFDPKTQTQKPIVVPQEGVIFTEIVAASPAKIIARATDPSVANDVNALADYFGNDTTAHLQNNVAVIDIRSVYNLDAQVGNFGATVPAGMIQNQSDPANATYQTRRARFLQIIQGIPIPDKTEKVGGTPYTVPQFAFGQAGNYLRQIIGYVPIEADGSVVAQVPADVPITFNILDANAQRIGPDARHIVWLQLRQGEVLRCTGCHDATSTAPHGRLESAAPDANSGATLLGSTGWIFPNVPEARINFKGIRSGQTIAQIYATNHKQPRAPSVNVYFSDEWASNPSQQNATLDYRYVNDNPPHLPPASSACITHWTPDCRIVINYEEHIQPLWEKSRRKFDNNGQAVLDGNGVPIDNKCTNCHAPTDSNGTAQAPAGQLNLTSVPSNQNAKVFLSNEQLFNTHNKKDAAGADILVPQKNPDGSPMLDAQGQPVLGPDTTGNVMNGGGAHSSSRFFNCFTLVAGGKCGVLDGGLTIDNTDVHVGLLTPAELRLISEWLDIGAQYFNDVGKAVTAGQ